MTEYKCESCYYKSCCSSSEEICEDFYPITERAEDKMIEDYVSKCRKEYCMAWFDYINENE